MADFDCLPCRAQFVKWAQTYNHPVHGRWERLQLVRCSSCGWDPPVLGWAAREAAVEAYCDALHAATRRRAQVAARAASTSALVTHGPAHGSAGQDGAPRSPQAGVVPDASPMEPSTAQQGSADGLAAAPAPARQSLPSIPGFEGLSLCLFRRVAKGETVLRRD